MSDPAGLAAAAAREWGLPEPELVRSGINELFRAGDDVVIRVGPSARPPAEERAWNEFLSSLGVGVPRWHRDRNVDGVAVVALEQVHPTGTVDWEAVGRMIRVVHRIEPGDAGELPWADSFAHWNIDAVLDEVGDLLDPLARAGIDATVSRWDGWQQRLRIGAVVCHGDLHPGNVLQSERGPVLLDWDLRCLAHPAWDHGPLIAWGDRWDATPALYEAFATGYGESLRGTWMGECMADLRNLVATLMRVRASRTDPAAAAQAEVRLRYWRGEPDAPRWTPM